MQIMGENLREQLPDGPRVGGVNHNRPSVGRVRILPSARRFARVDRRSRNGVGIYLHMYFPNMPMAPTPLCAKYNCGVCRTDTDLPYVVPETCGRLHACMFCLGGHAIDDCPALDFTFDRVMRHSADYAVSEHQAELRRRAA